MRSLPPVKARGPAAQRRPDDRVQCKRRLASLWTLAASPRKPTLAIGIRRTSNRFELEIELENRGEKYVESIEQALRWLFEGKRGKVHRLQSCA
jgi:hypothetical protein